MYRALCSILAVSILAALATAGAQARSFQGRFQQPVVGYAYSVTNQPDSCVKVGQAMQVVNVLKNQSGKPQTVMVWLYGIGTADPMMQKGPLLDVDTAKSGLSPSSDSSVWYWRVRLQPGQQLSRTLYIKQVPPGYYPSNWNSAWGAMPWPMLYMGGQAYVKNTRVQFPLSAQTSYCSLDGSVPYEIPPTPSPDPGAPSGGGK